MLICLNETFGDCKQNFFRRFFAHLTEHRVREIIDFHEGERLEILNKPGLNSIIFLQHLQTSFGLNLKWIFNIVGDEKGVAKLKKIKMLHPHQLLHFNFPSKKPYIGDESIIPIYKIRFMFSFLCRKLNVKRLFADDICNCSGMKISFVYRTKLQTR